jgi:tetratricopeptide (TPR) repeat protein
VASLVVILAFAIFIIYIAAKNTSKDTEIVVGQKRDIKEIGERIQHVLDTEKHEKRQQRRLGGIASEASKLLKERKLKQSEKKFLEIIKEDHKNLKAYHGLGMIYLQQKEYGGAAEVFEKICELSPTDDAAFNNCGMALFNVGKYEEAVKAYDHSVALNNKIAHRYINLALACDKSEHYKEEITALQKAIALEPEKVDYLEKLAAAAKKNDDPELVKKTYDKIIALDPENLEAHRELARFEKS